MKPSVAASFLGKSCSTSIPDSDSIWHLKQLTKGEHLYHAGDEFRYLFQVVRGSFKTLSSTSTGIEQVMDFHISGEFMGMDAISENKYPSTAIALEEGEVCAISYARLNELCATYNDVHNNVYIAMGREIRGNTAIITLLAHTKAKERVVIFLLDLLDRTATAGRETDVLPLPMKRYDIASFLGISDETLSRQFTKLQGLGLIRAQVNGVQILNRPALKHFRGSMADDWLSWTGATRAERVHGIRRTSSHPSTQLIDGCRPTI